MSTVFWDGLIDYKKIEILVKRSASTVEERDELNMLIDATITPRILEAILDDLPEDSHKNFLEIFQTNLHDRETIFKFIAEKRGKSTEDVEGALRENLKTIEEDLLDEFRPQDEVSREVSESSVSKK